MSSYIVQVFFKTELISTIWVSGEKVSFRNKDGVDPVFLPFGVETSATKRSLLEFYEDRCFPRERVNCNQILQTLGIPCYDPELICRKTHGLQFDDFVWLQFSDEPQVSWSDIKMRD